jgi:hypothetical protein
MRPHLLVLAFAALLLFARDSSAADGPVQQREFAGWSDCFEFSAPGAGVTATLVPSIGARLVRYALRGENILFDNPDAHGKTLANSKNFWAGGYQLDLGPEMRGIPTHTLTWMGAWDCGLDTRNALTAVSVEDASTGIRLTKVVAIDPASGRLRVDQAMTNFTDDALNYCLWDRTLCAGGGYSLIPLNPKSRFKHGWCLGANYKDGKWEYNTENPTAPNIRAMDGVLVTHCVSEKGAFGKLGADCADGWIAYARGKLLFIKTFPVAPDGNYTDGGLRVANYWNDRVAELEPIGEEVPLKPGETHSFNETWFLLPLEREIGSHEAARELVPLIQKTVAAPAGAP